MATPTYRIRNVSRNPLEFQFREGAKPKGAKDERLVKYLLLPADGGSKDVDEATLASLNELPAFQGLQKTGAVVNNRPCAAIEIVRPFDGS